MPPGRPDHLTPPLTPTPICHAIFIEWFLKRSSVRCIFSHFNAKGHGIQHKWAVDCRSVLWNFRTDITPQCVSDKNGISIPRLYKYCGCRWSHDVIASCTTPSLAMNWPLCAFFISPKTWQSHADKCGLSGGRERTSHRNCCSFSRVVLAEWGLTLLRHWQCCPWVTSLSAEVHDDRRAMSAWPYQSWVRRDSSSAGEMTVVSTVNSHFWSLDHITNTRTRPLRQYEPKTRLLLFNTIANVPGRYQRELPSAPRFNYSAPILQYPSDTPELVW